ncbi:hypothetical protein NEHOM01_0216 [Nematocida homosporus]|uniref:uncharacterized protein n=1 Tax=Nematocida homosporus TaxID=1912981 RepID=UPI00221F3D20|nr:uncharacterized protein NEHOM01_0216 [Nematocida homosporus]KAI5184541.1 hypothetical protein NEHOM01_0216 [Nematocida homosporus]
MVTRNSWILNGLLGGGRKKSRLDRSKLCLSYVLGLCPRLVLSGTAYQMGRCNLEHSWGRVEDLRSRDKLVVSERLGGEIRSILSKIKKNQNLKRTDISEYLKLEEELVLHRINGRKWLVRIWEAKLEGVKESYERRKVPYLACNSCPELMPWSPAKQAVHLRSKVHCAFIKMAQILPTLP